MKGRPCKLTAEVQRLLCEAIASGNNREDAALLAGIDSSTLRRWLKTARSKAGKFRTLLHAIKKAEAQAVNESVKTIRRAASRWWQAAAWWLERKYPETWGSDRAAIRELQKATKEHEKELAELRKLQRVPDAVSPPKPEATPQADQGGTEAVPAGQPAGDEPVPDAPD